MERNNRYISILRIVLLFVVGILLQGGHVAMGQVKKTEYGTQISDGSAPDALTPVTFSILELNSKERGFLMPRMTTLERDRMIAADLTEGMTIYNLTLDCIEFYNSTRKQWMNVCGGSEPAVYVIPELKCNSIKVNGDYTAGVLLNERTHNLVIEVNVSSPGAFDVEAIAYDSTGQQANGYVFTTSGVFPTAGDFVLVLRGKGTPKVGYAPGTGKDIVKFKLNKKDVGCTVKVDVAKEFENLLATMDCANAKALGTYKINVPLTEANTIEVNVTVTKNGRGRVYGTVNPTGAQTETIKYESDLIDFSTKNSPVKVVLKPTVDSGKPTTSGKLDVLLRLETRGQHEYDPFIPPKPANIVSCTILKLDVESDGPKYNLNSVSFQGSFFSNTGGAFYVTPRTNMGTNGSDDFRIIAKVTPKAAGEYLIESNNKNGIYFKGKRDVTSVEAKNGAELSIPLKAYGTSKTDLKLSDPEADFTITTNNMDTGLTSSKTLKIDFVYRPMRMYSIGHQAWHPGGDYSGYSSAPDLVFNSSNFGWNGIVRIDGLTSLSSPGSSGNRDEFSSNHLTNTTTFNTTIDKADIFVNGGYSYSRNSTQMAKLISKINNKTIAAIFTEDNSNTSMANMISFINGINGRSDTYSPTSFTEAKDNGDQYLTGDVFVNSPQGKTLFSDRFITSFPATVGSQYTMSGAHIGSGYRGGFYLDKVPSGFDVLSFAGNGKYFSLVHQSKGVVTVFAEAFMGGRPAASRSDKTYSNYTRSIGIPDSHTGYSNTTYNSYFLLNLIHWAIDYAQANQPNEIK